MKYRDQLFGETIYVIGGDSYEMSDLPQTPSSKVFDPERKAQGTHGWVHIKKLSGISDLSDGQLC